MACWDAHRQGQGILHHELLGAKRAEDVLVRAHGGVEDVDADDVGDVHVEVCGVRDGAWRCGRSESGHVMSVVKGAPGNDECGCVVAAARSSLLASEITCT